MESFRVWEKKLWPSEDGLHICSYAHGYALDMHSKNVKKTSLILQNGQIFPTKIQF